jgi:sugar lactone lactonase YvrE
LAGEPAASRTAAQHVLGQLDLIHGGINMAKANSLYFPSFVTVDSQHHLYVVDGGNNRILGWLNEASLANGQSADLVIGQPDFQAASCNDGTQPGDMNGVGPDSLCLEYPSPFTNTSQSGGIAVDESGNIFVSDTGNHRVLEYNSPFDSCASFPCVGPSANLVIGQPDFVSNLCNQGNFLPSAGRLCATDAKGNFYVSDPGNYRVLEYNTPLDPKSGEPGAGDGQADAVFGASDFNSPSDCEGSIVCGALGVAIDEPGNLYVAAAGRNLVVEFNAPLDPNSGEPGAGDNLPDNLFGFSTTGGCAVFDGIPDATSLCFPSSVSVDSSGNVYVADTGNSRIVEYNTPFNPSSGEPGAGNVIADEVIGQPDLTSGNCNQGPPGSSQFSTLAGNATLCRPFGIAVDGAGRLVVGDSANSRTIFFPVKPGAPAETASQVLGQLDMVHDGINLVDGRSLNFPQGAVADSAGHFYVADLNGRILGWRDIASFQNGQAADLVIGQPDFASIRCDGVNATSVCGPRGLAVDSSGDLFVADVNGNRILEFDSPFNACESYPCVGQPAARVIGQPTFSSGDCNNGNTKPSAFTLCGPFGIAMDGRNNLYVADYGNSRVLEYDGRLKNLRRSKKHHRIAANRVFGQTTVSNGTCNGNGLLVPPSPDQRSLCSPTAVALDHAGNLLVVDSNNNRVVEYSMSLRHSHIGGPKADLVLGQTDFVSATLGCSLLGGTTTDSQFCSPIGVATDSSGDVFVSDVLNNRVLVFESPLSTGEHASRVIGQSASGAFKCNSGGLPDDIAGLGPDSLCISVPGIGGLGIGIDSSQELYLGDSGNNRILFYPMP